jgi:hypothetical protein
VGALFAATRLSTWPPFGLSLLSRVSGLEKFLSAGEFGRAVAPCDEPLVAPATADADPGLLAVVVVWPAEVSLFARELRDGAEPVEGRSPVSRRPKPGFTGRPVFLTLSDTPTRVDEAGRTVAACPAGVGARGRVGTLTCERSGTAGRLGRTIDIDEPLLTSCSRRVFALVAASRTVAVGTWPPVADAMRARPMPLLMMVLLSPLMKLLTTVV